MDFWVSKGTLTWQIIQDAVKFEDKNMMMTWLKMIFRTKDNIFFHACCVSGSIAVFESEVLY